MDQINKQGEVSKRNGKEGMNEMSDKISVPQAVEQVRQTVGLESETIQETVTDLSNQIGRLREDVTGVVCGPGEMEAPYSLLDIGNMLAALYVTFEPQIKAKAFQLFDEVAKRIHAGEEKGSAWMEVGIPPAMHERFYAEWLIQQEAKKPVINRRA